MKNFAKVILSGLLIAASFGATAQDDDDDSHDIVIGVPSVALVDIEGASGTTINLGADAPTEAGLPVDFSTGSSNSDLWINYSSIKDSANATRKISAKISTGTLPSGMTLSVTAGADAGNGDGTMGTSAGAVSLTTSDQDVITGIGSAYTDDGASNGHNLTYDLTLTGGAGNYAQLDASNNTTIEITYTISDL